MNCQHKGQTFPIRSQGGATLIKCVVCGRAWSEPTNPTNPEFEQLEMFSEKEN